MISLDVATPHAATSDDAEQILRQLLVTKPSDPYPLYARLREIDPVYRGRDGTWFVFGYPEAAVVLASYGMLKRKPTEGTTPRAPWGTRRALATLMDPRVSRLESRIRSRALTLLSDESVLDDLVDGYCRRIPIEAGCELLGIPATTRGQVAGWTRAIHDGDVHNGTASGDGAGDADRQLRSFLRELYASHRWDRPEYVERLALTVDEWEALGVMILVSSQTTPPVLANAILTLLQHPGHWHQYGSQPRIRMRAIEELLRISSPFHALFPRTARHALVVAGKPISTGEQVVVVIASANRDPRRFADPDVLRFDRPRMRTMSFSLGPSFCLGSSFVRFQMRLAVEVLTTRFPQLHLGEGSAPWHITFGARACERLAVTTDGV